MTIAEQEKAGKAFWKQAAEQWPPPVFRSEDYQGKLWWTLVIRPDEIISDTMLTVSSALRNRWPGLLYYPAESYHVTVTNIGQVPEIRHYREDIISSLKKASQKLGKIDLHYATVNIGSSLVVQVFDQTGSMRSLVKKCLENFQKEKIPAAQDVGPHVGLWWTVLARFTEETPREIVRDIERYEKLDFGRQSVTSIELVETDKIFSDQNTETIATIPLG
ncbi:MAG: hypothetical protein Q8Q20_00980 [bacterium]|nr:hypothetical protein [bacterium]